MANFPTSVFSPASRTNGQTIDQSWFNGLQDEVTAIEDGFRNATAPLNSSRSTLVSLNVTGGSTLATLSVTGASTFGAMTLGASTLASLSVTGASTLASLSVAGASTFAARPTMPPPHLAILALNVPVNLTNATSLAIPWIVQSALTNSSLHSTTTNPSRVTPQSTGVYAISANIALSASLNQSTSELNVQIQDSSAAVLAIGQLVGDTDDDASVHASVLKRFDVTGGWVRAVVYVRDGSTASVRVAASGLYLHKL